MMGTSYYGSFYGYLYGSGAPAPLVGAAPIATGAPMYDGDPLLLHTFDGGDVRILQGEPARSGGLHNAVYLSLFGGNDHDTGVQGDRRQWWGNALERDPAYQYRGRTAYLLRTLPTTGPSLPTITAAIADDLAWMVELGLADSVDASVTVVGPKRVVLDITIIADGTAESFRFAASWGAQS